MKLAIDDNGKITTPFLFLDGRPIELFLSYDSAGSVCVSDQGIAYDAVGIQTEHCGFTNDWMHHSATSICIDFGVQYEQGVFIKNGITESTLEESVYQLVTAMLLFYGMNVGACRVLQQGDL